MDAALDSKENEMSTRYALSTYQLLALKRVCEYTGLHWRAMAARPAVAKRLIADYHEDTMRQTIEEFRASH